MQRFKQSDLKGIRFDSDSMQVLSVSRREILELPVVDGPVNFTVYRSDGKFSNRWGVSTNGKGDAYIYCRDNPNAEKVSLHASGQQHISIRSEVATSVGAASRFGNKWKEPEFGSEAIATFTLYFPPWGVGLERADFPMGINRDELLIVGHPEKAVVVAFFIVNRASNMRGRVPHIVLGRLPLGEEKTLHVAAWKEGQGNLMDRAQEAFPTAARESAERSLKGGEYTMSVQGYLRPNSAYMMVFPVRYTSPESEDIIRATSKTRRQALQALADR